ncbi:MAG: hypothetical protein HYV09_09150 [Deltaproteobacteria bacterium]|nr:hypothetical protein [Deltaproteobacteria bacterium]
MRPILIVHESTHGHTTKVAETLADHFRKLGHGAHVDHSGEADGLVLDRFQGIVLAGSIHGGAHVQPTLIEFVKRHHAELAQIPTALVIVCMAAARDRDSAREAVERYFSTFAHDTGLEPMRKTAFGDELPYTRYGLIERLAVQLVSRAQGDPTDTTRDHDLTDWNAVAAFARTFAGDVDQAARSRPTYRPPVPLE